MVSPAERRQARATNFGGLQIRRLKLAAERFGAVPTDRWLTPYPAGFVLRHLWLGGEEAGLWRFGALSRRLPDGPESHALFNAAAPEAFGALAGDLARQIAIWSQREPADPERRALEEGVRRADRVLAATRMGRNDQAIVSLKADYNALKRRLGRLTWLHDAQRLYRYLVYRELWIDWLGPPVAEDALARALWPRDPRYVQAKARLASGV